MAGNLILSLHHKEGYCHHGMSIKILLCFSKPQFSYILPGSASVPNSQIVSILEACTSRVSVKVSSFIKGTIFRICLCHYSGLMCPCLTIEPHQLSKPNFFFFFWMWKWHNSIYSWVRGAEHSATEVRLILHSQSFKWLWELAWYFLIIHKFWLKFFVFVIIRLKIPEQIWPK